MITKVTINAFFVVLALVLLVVHGTNVSAAQSPDAVLKGEQITEEALIKAFAPEPHRNSRGLVLKPGVPASQPRRKGVLITFETNSTQLHHDGKTALDRVARAFTSEQLAPLKFVIEGHADPRGSAQDNLRLSLARAQSVLNYLVTVKGLATDRLKAVGKGDRELLNTRVLTAPENRRVTFVTAAP
jgi:OmpA-OmpF porin, OOP family